MNLGPKLLIAPCRSGSTAFIQSMSQNPQVQAKYQIIKSGQRINGNPDYSIFDEKPKADKKIIVDKETIGHSTEQDCKLEVFPSDEAIVNSQPIFLLRDPVATWNSWIRAEWGTIDLFEIAYKKVIELYRRAKNICPEVRCITYEQMGKDIEHVLRQICDSWNIEFHPDMINWKTILGVNSPIEHRSDVKELIEAGREGSNSKLRDVSNSRTFSCRENNLIIPQSQIDRIKRSCQEEYEAFQGQAQIDVFDHLDRIPRL